MSLWLVRAGESGQNENLALENNLAAIDFKEVPDLSKARKREDFIEILQQAYPGRSPNFVRNLYGQLWAFSNGMQAGDPIALPLKSRSAIVIGRVRGPYAWRADLPVDARHTRPVEWLREFPRSAFDQDLLYSLGAFMTVCQIKRNNAEERIEAMLAGKPKAGDPDGVPPPEPPPDIEEHALDQIRSQITRKFMGHGLPRLVAALLEAQGYQVRVSPEGPDGGVDILAGRGPLGFDAPRLAVQVKSQDSPVEVKVLRELQGVMENFSAEQGLLVSWGGYKGAVHKEAARKFFKVRLWDADDLVRMIQANYDKLPEEIQADLPLKRIWILVPGEE